ncbi:hypothetical protein TIFTF001_031662 [Ficus carica]|uniref:Uncharacterized protein n=1 Tax=Ficus carica TaxID=3494 RepID=A0AA88DVN4_FICCA|nr:hypothetical protein TIFTF001_031662 [Ficus carica]
MMNQPMDGPAPMMSEVHDETTEEVNQPPRQTAQTPTPTFSNGKMQTITLDDIPP